MNLAVRLRFAVLSVALFAATGTAAMASDEPAMPSSASATAEEASALLARADGIKTTDFATFSRLLDNAAASESRLDSDDKSLLHFLRGWRATWVGDYEVGKAELDRVADTATNNVLRARATATLVNLLGVGHRYEQAFVRLSQLQEMMPSIRDRKARFQALGEASQMLSSAGQFEQAEAYAQQMMDDPPPGETICKGGQHLLRARREANRLVSLEPIYQRAIDACVGAGEEVFADGMRADVAAFHLTHDQPAEAVKLLTAHRDGLRTLNYPALLAEFDALLAQAYLKLDDLPNARRYGLSALAGSIRDEFTDPRRTGYEVLYQVEQRLGNAPAALNYHEQYMAADKAYLNDLSARSLAFQIVDQQLLARKAEVDALNKQNEILRLGGVIDRKEVETG
ncbi:MAG: hypothetical protein ABWZ54_02100, partial [Luteibacter sp.]